MSGRSNPDKEMSFWDHLEEFRWVLVRCLVAILGFATVAFCLKEPVFEIIFAPKDANFIVYRALALLAERLQMPSMSPPDFSVDLINIQLASQFFIHLRVSFLVGVLAAFPYVMYELWKFIRPALYERERRSAGPVLFYCCFLFYAGLAVGYFMVFPLTVQFLGTYQVSELVPNQISLNSYMDIFIVLLVMMGVVFEMPILAYFLAVIGFISSSFLTKNRKIAFVIIMAVAALVTPTGDAFTLSVVTLPMYLLYELSIAVVKRAERKPLDPNRKTPNGSPNPPTDPLSGSTMDSKNRSQNPNASATDASATDAARDKTTAAGAGTLSEAQTKKETHIEEEPEDFYSDKDMYGIDEED